tara:strand:- start:298 stop:930 length:633 start_codon:yes stop_codon:yes gene_type:complete
MIKILIADDHFLFRKGLKQTINDNPGMVVAAEAVDGTQAVDKIQSSDFDLAILDVSMPGPNIFDLIGQVKAARPGMPVLVLTMHPENQYAVRLFKAGASGYLTKDVDEPILISAVRKIAKGGKYVSPSLADIMADTLGVDHERPVHECLSDREFQVMVMLARGKAIGGIAWELNLGVSTISTYRSRILSKTGLKTNADIIQYALTHGLVP